VTAVSTVAFKQAIGMLRRGGTCVLNGLPPGEFPVSIFDVVLNGYTIRGSIVGTRLDLEEALEFAAEGKRRTDMIRHGKFTTWTESIKNGVCGASGTCGAARAAFRILFPIPATQLGSNPLLTQNAGY